MVGFPAIPANVRPSDIMRRELDVLGSRVNNHKFPQVISYMEKGIIHPERIISHVIPIEQAEDAFKLFCTPLETVMKVVFTF